MNNDQELNRILKKAEIEMLELNHPYVGSEHLLLSILKSKNNLNNILKIYNITYNSFKKELIKVIGIGTKKSSHILYTPLLKRIINNAKEDAIEKKDSKVTSKHLLMSMIEEGDGIAIRILINSKADLEGLYDELKNLNKKEIIMSFGQCLNDIVDKNNCVVERDKIIENVIEILFRKQKCNPLLIGKAGVGKTAIVEELARRIELKNVPIGLQKYKIINIDMSELVAGTKYRGEFEERLNKLLNEITKQNNIIIFIDEIHTIVGAGGAEGAIDASNILKPYLARGTIKCIGATTLNEYNKHIKKDKALERRFETIIVEEPNHEQTLNILKRIKKNYSSFHNVRITNNNINDIMFYSNKYIHNRCNPDKSIDLLDLVCSKANINNTQINSKFIEQTIKEKMGIIDYKNNIGALEAELNKKTIGQTTAIKELLNNISDEKRYILLNGKTGVGKNYILDNFCNILNITPIIIDMSMYTNETSINKLIGSPPGYVGYDDEGILNQVNNISNTIFIIDNIQLANIKIKEIFNNICKNSFIFNNKNEKLFFDNSIIFFTSNIENNTIGFNDEKSNINIEIDFSSIIELSNASKFNITCYLKEKGINESSIIEEIILESDYKKSGYKKLNNCLNNIKCH